MRLELLEKLHDGHLAEVFIGRLNSEAGPELVTVRRILRQVAQTQGVVDSLAGASTGLTSRIHDNLCRHIGFFEGAGEYYWLSRRVDGFDLATVHTRLATREVHIHPLHSLQIGLDFIRGLRVFHDQGQVHGGPSSHYVLVGYDGVGRLDGAGFESTLLGCRDLKQRARNGRATHLAPELLQGRKPTLQSDVFSAAAVVYLLLTGRPPLESSQRSGAGMSVRKAAVAPPTQIDRSLPFSCDALFEKALGITPQGRHESAKALYQAFHRLRAAMLKGADEGREGVREFIESLYPNEAIVPGQPGTLDRYPRGEEIQLVQVTGGSPSELAGEAGEVDSEALARIAAWESKFGPVQGDSGNASRPPPLPGKQEPAGGPARSRRPAKTSPKSSDSVVVDWTGLSGEPDPPVPGGGSDWDRIPTQVSAPPEEAIQEQEVQAPEDEFVTEPEMSIEGVEEDSTETPVAAPEPGPEPLFAATAQDEDESIQEVAAAADTTPQGAAPIQTTRARLSFWRRPAGWLTVVFLVALAIGAAVYIVHWSSPVGDQPAAGDAGQPAKDTTPVGFLTVTTDGPARITLDGELLPGKAPLKNKLVRAGRHRLLLDSEQGKRLFDETVTVRAGEHRTIRVVTATAKATETPQPATSIGEKKKRVKSRRRRRPRNRRRRKKRRRTRRRK